MAYHEIGVETVNSTTGDACVEIIGSTAIQARLIEIGISVSVIGSVNPSGIGFGRPAAAGVTPTSPITVLGEDANDAPTTKVATAWGTSPTAPSVYMRRLTFPPGASLGTGAIWRFSPGIVIAKSGAGNSLVLQNILGVAGRLYVVWIVVDEE